MLKPDVFKIKRWTPDFEVFELKEPGVIEASIRLRPLNPVEMCGAQELYDSLAAMYITGGFEHNLVDGSKEWRDKPLLLLVDRDGGYTKAYPKLLQVVAHLERMQGINRLAGELYEGDGFSSEELCAIAAKMPLAWGQIEAAYVKTMRRQAEWSKKASTDSEEKLPDSASNPESDQSDSLNETANSNAV